MIGLSWTTILLALGISLGITLTVLLVLVWRDRPQ